MLYEEKPLAAYFSDITLLKTMKLISITEINKTYFMQNLRCNAFVIHLHGHKKEFGYIKIFGDKFLATYFKPIALFQT